jgi:hypothetical protein
LVSLVRVRIVGAEFSPWILARSGNIHHLHVEDVLALDFGIERGGKLKKGGRAVTWVNDLENVAVITREDRKGFGVPLWVGSIKVCDAGGSKSFVIEVGVPEKLRDGNSIIRE